MGALPFADGFEDGDFRNWNGTYGTPSVETDNPHHGTYNMEWSTDYDACYLTFTGTRTVYARVYFYIVSESFTNNNWTNIITMFNGTGGTNRLCRVSIFHNPSELLWRLSYRSGGSETHVESSQQKPAGQTWYCVELQCTCSTADGNLDGEYHVWINGTELDDIDQTGIDTDYTTVQRFDLGSYLQVGTGTFNVDCFEADTSRVYCEGEEPPPSGIKDNIIPRAMPQLLNGCFYNLTRQVPKLSPRVVA